MSSVFIISHHFLTTQIWCKSRQHDNKGKGLEERGEGGKGGKEEAKKKKVEKIEKSYRRRKRRRRKKSKRRRNRRRRRIREEGENYPFRQISSTLLLIRLVLSSPGEQK